MGMPIKKSNSIIRKIMQNITKQKKYSLVEAFSGPGGMSLGLGQAGFSLKLAFDYDEPSVKTHNYNLGNHCIQADAAQITGKDILKRTKLKKGELALLAGGPPCQGFSKQKRGAHLGDERNVLVSHYIRLVSEIKPRFFIFENVAIFGQKRGKQFLQEMFQTLTDYQIYPHFYNSADYGLAQTRERFIAIGRRTDQKVSLQIPAPSVTKWKTVGDVIAGLPEPPEDYTNHPEYPNHLRAKVTAINIKRFSFVPQGGGWKDIPEDLRIASHKVENLKSGGWPDVYGRLDWKSQCPTITGGFDSFTRGRFGHPVYDRPITPREAARLQGFPDSFVFLGTKGDVRSQIGNAVPPPLAKAVGTEIMRSLLCVDGLLKDTGIDAKCENQFQLAFS